MRRLLDALTGQTADDAAYVGRAVWSRKTPGERQKRGKVTNTGVCRLDGCGGCALSVLWEDGRRTYPCVNACKERADGALEIR